LKKPIIILLIILNLTAGICTIPAKNTEPRTIFVDDDNIDGPWEGINEHPYITIKDGINASEDGDEIFVYEGNYFESDLMLNKSILLHGENKFNTIINPLNELNLSMFFIQKNDVEIAGFTFNPNFGIIAGNPYTILNNIKLKDNIFYSMVTFGQLEIKNIEIANNHFSGIDSVLFFLILQDATSTTIYNNSFEDTNNNPGGFILFLPHQISDQIKIYKNDFINTSTYTILADINYSENGSNNLLKTFPKKLSSHLSEMIVKQGKKDNKIQAKLIHKPPIYWSNNYWDNWIGFGPKLIIGYNSFFIKEKPILLPLIQFDWHPAKQPHNTI